MTAIAIGKLPNANVIISDAIVQLDTNHIGHKNARVEDKIYDIQSSEQYVTLCGEQLLMHALYVIDLWLLKRNKSIDLMNVLHFNQFLLTADKHREILQKNETNPIPFQEATTLYVVSSLQIKAYQISFLNGKYAVQSEVFLNDNELVINYKGNIKIVKPFITKLEEIFEKAKNEILKEHEYRKLNGKSIGKKPLNYDFENKFSALIIPHDTEEKTIRIYPDNDLTDFYLSQWPDWDFINSPKFKWSPDFDFPDKI